MKKIIIGAIFLSIFGAKAMQLPDDDIESLNHQISSYQEQLNTETSADLKRIYSTFLEISLKKLALLSDLKKQMQGGFQKNLINDFFKQVKNNNPIAVHIYLLAGIDPNIKDDKGKTALSYAVKNRGQSDLVNTLLMGGAQRSLLTREEFDKARYKGGYW